MPTHTITITVSGPMEYTKTVTVPDERTAPMVRDLVSVLEDAEPAKRRGKKGPAAKDGDDLETVKSPIVTD